MATFTVREVEGMRQVRIDMTEETVRVEAGALSTMTGAITMRAPMPGPRDLLRWALSDEAPVRPSYTGSGHLLLQPSIAGFHVFDCGGEAWTLEPGVYLASEAGIDVGVVRERFWAGLWAGDGFLKFLTRVEGRGEVAIHAPGPVEVVPVENGAIKVQGRLVLGCTAGLRFTSELALGWPRNLLARQKRLRVFSGAGRALVCWTPYWNQQLYERLTGESIEGSLFE
jgi:uncharacterized protein (AIM24 family)